MSAAAAAASAVQVQGYLSQPRSITATHFGTGLLKGEVLPANSRLVSRVCVGTGPCCAAGWVSKASMRAAGVL